MQIRGAFTLGAIVLLAVSYADAQAPPAKQPDPAKAALIEELIVALKVEPNQQQMMQTMQASILNQIDQMMDSQLETLSDGSQADAEKKRSIQTDVQDFQSRLFALMTTHMSWPTMKPVIVAMYDDTFTADELRPLVAFFKSPAGQAYIDKMPAMMGNMMKRTQQVVVDMMPDMQKLNAEFMQQMKEKYPGKQ